MIQPRASLATASPGAPMLRGALLACVTLLLPLWAEAGERLLATSGVAQVEGAAGGGLTPWAVIAGHGSSDQVGASVHASHVHTQGGYNLSVQGVAVGVHDRVEVSMARWSFRLSDTVAAQTLHLNMLGVKLRVWGDALHDQDRWWPQVSLGLQHKANDDHGGVPAALGSRRASDTDAYVSATKIWLGLAWGHNVVGTLTLRATRANQFGLLGFGGDVDDRHSVLPEVSAAVLLRDDLALGAEWRAKPDKLKAFREENAHDVFVAWFPHRNLSLTAAWLQLGNIANKPAQRGLYLSGQLAF